MLEGVLEYFQASDHSVDNLTNRTEPIRKCADLAHSLDYMYFVVSSGLCYSGSKELVSFLNDGAESVMCNKNSTESYFDVYHIEDPEIFTVSSNEVKNCGPIYCTNSSLVESCSGYGIPSGTNIRTSSISLVLLLLLLIYLL